VTSKRVLLLGAETEIGAETARALAEAGHTLALIASTADAEAAFAVQRLARKLNATTSQAIDAGNEAAVRVMVRQVAKALGGLDAVGLCPVTGTDPRHAFQTSNVLSRLVDKEFRKAGSGILVQVFPGEGYHSVMGDEPMPYIMASVYTKHRPNTEVAAEVVRAIECESPAL